MATLLLVYGMTFTRVGIAKVMASPSNRPIVNTGILIGRASVKTVASLSKRFAMGTPRGNSLIISCVNCLAGAVGVSNGGGVGIILDRSDGTLSRMVIVNCNDMGGRGLASSISGVASRTIGRHPMTALKRTLTNGLTNIHTRDADNIPNRRLRVHVHNIGAVGNDDSPLCIVSNMPCRDVDSVGPTSITSVRILGSTSTASVCNTHNTGKIVLVRAGRNDSGPTIAFSNFCNLRSPRGCMDVVSTGR